jgi:hypothetical protein
MMRKSIRSGKPALSCTRPSILRQRLFITLRPASLSQVPDRDLTAIDHLLQPAIGQPAGGDVFVDPHGLTLGRGTFAHPDQAAIGELVFAVPDLGQRAVKPALQGYLIPFTGRAEDAAVDRCAEKVVVERAFHDQVGNPAKRPG